jgi:hypothetical protein
MRGNLDFQFGYFLRLAVGEDLLAGDRLWPSAGKVALIGKV